MKIGYCNMEVAGNTANFGIEKNKTKMVQLKIKIVIGNFLEGYLQVTHHVRGDYVNSKPEGHVVF